MTITKSKFNHVTLFLLTFLTFLDHLLVQGRPVFFVIQYFRLCAMFSVSWHFFMSPCMLSFHLFFGRPRLLLPETSSLSDFAQMLLLSRLKQWPNHFSLLFSRNVATGFTCASFRMSSFRMWSNLVFPLAHLNNLISAELSLFSSFFFTAQHAGLMIVLKTLSFNSTGIFLSDITPDTSFHFIHPIRILLLTSACEPPSLVNSDPRYLKDVTVGSSPSTIFTVVPVSFCGARQVFRLCTADLQPMPLKHNSSCFQVFLHFFTSHSTQHQVVCEHHRPGWILLYVFR